MRSAGKMISRHIANAIARRLDRMHFDSRKFLENLRHVFQCRPVVLDVLTRREMREATVIIPRNGAKPAQLAARQCAIGDRNTQHIGM